ncbi:MAG: 50S ribosomal protein L4 [Candidatus Korarchaeota archaeon]
MKANVLGLDGKVVKSITLPKVFSAPVEPYLIKRAVIALQSHKRQPQGRDPLAGKRAVAYSWGVGHGLARVPRLSNRTARFAPGTVKGRLAHPPRAEKKIYLKINRKEKKLALISAIAATAKKEIVQARGHIVGDLTLPVVVTDEFENLEKTKDVINALTAVGIEDIYRVRKKIRAGKGKRRGRKYKVSKGPLIVVSKKDVKVYNAARNIAGVEIVPVDSLNVELLAPGTVPGRLTIWTETAISSLKKYDEIMVLAR